jgi:tRNA (uracil-5-)-methyltransferase
MMFVQGISYVAAKKKKGMTVGFVTFGNIEQLTNAVEVIVCSFVLAACLVV